MGPKYMTAGMGDAGACVKPDFTVLVNDKIMPISELYDQYVADPTVIRLIGSANYACTIRDQKKIDVVTCRDYSGEIIKFTTDNGHVLETTPDHLIPVMRNNTRIILCADKIVETDKLIGV
jgi:intein/homing endonuclease